MEITERESKRLAPVTNLSFWRSRGFILFSLYTSFVANFFNCLLVCAREYVRNDHSLSYRSISRLLGACVLSLICRLYAKTNVGLVEDLEWTEKFLYDGSIHSYSVVYAWGLTQFILNSMPSSLKPIILNHRFLPQTMVGVIVGALDTCWRYSGRNRMQKERKLGSAKASNHKSGRSTVGIYMASGMDERVENRRASLSIVDEGDSDVERESPKISLQQAPGLNDVSPSGTPTSALQLSRVDINTSALAPPRTPERAAHRLSSSGKSRTPHRSPYRRDSSKYNGNYQSYHMHHSPLLKAAARAVDKAVKRNYIDEESES